MLVDTDVLIWHLRGYPQATKKLDSFSALTISAITIHGTVARVAQQGRDECIAAKPGDAPHATLATYPRDYQASNGIDGRYGAVRWLAIG